MWKGDRSVLCGGPQKGVYKRDVKSANNAGDDIRYLSAKEVAAIVKVDERTVRRWAEQKLLKKHRLGPRAVRYDIQELGLAGARN